MSSRLEAVILLGNPNVGKSVIFGHLTDRYVTVSNYPGTTVEVTRGTAATPAGRVGDARNLERTLLLSLELAEAGRPFVLCLNMGDEAEERGTFALSSAGFPTPPWGTPPGSSS